MRFKLFYGDMMKGPLRAELLKVSQDGSRARFHITDPTHREEHGFHGPFEPPMVRDARIMREGNEKARQDEYVCTEDAVERLQPEPLTRYTTTSSRYRARVHYGNPCYPIYELVAEGGRVAATVDGSHFKAATVAKIFTELVMNAFTVDAELDLSALAEPDVLDTRVNPEDR